MSEDTTIVISIDVIAGLMSSPDRESIGVDRDGDRWLAVGISGDNDPSAAVFETIDALWETHGATADRIVVDVPIGLCGSLEEENPNCKETDGELSRHCDDLARSLIGARSSSVFPAPCRAAAQLGEENDSEYRTVNETNKDHTGKGLTRQAASITPAIMEVESLLTTKADTDVLLEGHPELCFRAFNTSDLTYSKKTAPGVIERLELLKDLPEFTRNTWRELTHQLADDGHAAGLDDVLDAMALAATAAAPPGEFHPLPANPPTDTEGHPMQMVYRRRTPFEANGE